MKGDTRPTVRERETLGGPIGRSRRIACLRPTVLRRVFVSSNVWLRLTMPAGGLGPCSEWGWAATRTLFAGGGIVGLREPVAAVSSISIEDNEMRGLISTSSDGSLIRASVSKPQAFAGLFDRHAKAIWRYACRRIGAPTSSRPQASRKRSRLSKPTAAMLDPRRWHRSPGGGCWEGVSTAVEEVGQCCQWVGNAHGYGAVLGARPLARCSTVYRLRSVGTTSD